MSAQPSFPVSTINENISSQVATPAHQKALLPFLFLMFICLGVALLYQARELQFLRTQLAAERESNDVSTNKAPAQTLVEDETKATDFAVYQVEAKLLAGDGIDQTGVYAALKDQLSDTTSFKVFHDNTYRNYSQSPIRLYYLTEHIVPLGKKISTDSVALTVLEEKPELLPYLQDAKYCTSDADCSSAGRFCDVGAYNEYHQFVVFGCGGINSIEGYSEQDIKDLECPLSEITGMPDVRADFTTAKCIQNTCTAVDMQVTCAKN